MKILVFEDDDQKFDVISSEIQASGASKNSISRAKALNEFFRLQNRPFDLCIIDVFLPLVEGGSSIDVSNEILALIEQTKGMRIPLLAITAYAKEAEGNIAQLASKGCMMLDYHEKGVWSKALAFYLAQAKDRHRYDFLIFCALKEERDAFLKLANFKPTSVLRSQIDLWDFEWEGRSGGVVLFPRMGLVSAAILTSRVLENYSPRVVCMAGICGAADRKSELGQLLITELCWEYQSGKWFDEYFAAEPYQTEISEKTRSIISKDLEDVDLVMWLEENFEGGQRPTSSAQPRLAPFATGSAVIASEKRLQSVVEQHRKVVGIDMEIYGFHRAVRLCNEDIIHFSAKTVVDKGDSKKSDNFHDYGSFVSAKYCLRLCLRLLNEHENGRS